MTESKRLKMLKKSKAHKKNINVQRSHARYVESPKRLKEVKRWIIVIFVKMYLNILWSIIQDILDVVEIATRE